MNPEIDKTPQDGGRSEKDHNYDGHHHHGEHHHDPHDHDGGPWKLNVQGVVIESPHPEIGVRHAIKQARFHPDTPCTIILKVAGEPKKEVALNYVIDLR